MTPLTRQRMVHPQIATDVGLRDIRKRLIYMATMWLAEDSGCFIWSARAVRGAAFPLEPEVTDEQVAGKMHEMAEDGYYWRYDIGGVECAFIPAFPEWQAALTWSNAPRLVPLPVGITYEGYETKHRYGSVKYAWPKTKPGLLGDSQSTAC